ncbi:hypothetical protein AA23498_2020 [Acetobacter nitrogenifigens DSM 23921 = NBRC 105050]|uniref:Uncharacterized protein n=1 Tax=Acetobacter nitrogenifigens DSM 23921 = NBRC 105050 TaxID=1120919 RepID=A0A511X6D7_9PROT|nr:hypothetical protein [Acetobacter nitrogenifigens]GBQ94408.1 hypothetical protein AA23498_2020 [Acetobacter nitrogenifigens DSM 23921 = NBRC 105050]GEN58513.1 hypothetical protein ANI02nite_03970 [Acetobacter nitrogenifigens DSM 23921 = NBRC 105050]
MRRSLFLPALALGLTVNVTHSMAAAPKQETSVVYTAPQTSGSWASMGLPAITVSANRAAGPASRLLVHLPDFLRKGGKADYALAPDGANAWKTSEDGRVVSFTLQSENSAVFKMEGATSSQHIELPVFRF